MITKNLDGSLGLSLPARHLSKNQSDALNILLLLDFINSNSETCFTDPHTCKRNVLVVAYGITFTLSNRDLQLEKPFSSSPHCMTL